jgi:TPR repeat protein
MDSVGGFYSLGMAGVQKDCKAAMGWFEKSAASGYALAANNLAYLFVTCPDKKLRNPKKAEEIMHAMFLGTPTLPAVLDTYAAVLASQGEFPKAVATMKVAIDIQELIGANPEQIDEAKATLAHYQKRKLPDFEPAKPKQKKH